MNYDTSALFNFLKSLESKSIFGKKPKNRTQKCVAQEIKNLIPGLSPIGRATGMWNVQPDRSLPITFFI